jgi:MYXO-CTERM domain-containing protein
MSFRFAPEMDDTMAKLSLRSLCGLILMGGVALGSVGCGEEEGGALREANDHLEEYRSIPLMLEAPCTVNVEGFGHVNVEDDYIPNVVACENGNAPLEALKAQAIQARGFLYYKLGTGATVIRNSQSDQVYKCSYTTARDIHFQAARETRGLYLSYQGTTVAPFYVAGAIPPNPNSGEVSTACKGTGGTDRTNTERYVTYNEGLSGCNIKMSPLGWVPTDCLRNKANRGCASQNGQACMARRGWGYERMIRFYYGADIVLSQAGGTCGGPYVPPTEHDVYCAGQATDGGYCYDDATRVVCQGDKASTVAACENGCANGTCWAERDEAWFCWQQRGTDGWLCYDADLRVQCSGGQLQATDSCSAGCEAGVCLVPPVDDGGTSDPQPPGQEPGPGLPGHDGSGGGDGGGTGATPGPGGGRPPQTELGPLVSTSMGVEGGCSTAGSPHGSPSVLLIVIGALFAAVRRRRL